MARRGGFIGGDAAGMSAAAQARRMTSAGELEMVVGRRLHRTGGRGGAPHYIGVAIFATVGLVIAGAIMGAVI